MMDIWANIASAIMFGWLASAWDATGAANITVKLSLATLAVLNTWLAFGAAQ